MELSGLSTIDYVIVGTYFIATIAAGLFLSKKASAGITAYFLGGRTIPWWAIGMSGTASNFDMTGTQTETDDSTDRRAQKNGPRLRRIGRYAACRFGPFSSLGAGELTLSSW